MSTEKANPYERQVVLEHVEGEQTGQEYNGKFRVLVVLSQGLQLRRGVIFRELLGAHSGSASGDEVGLAERLSDLAVRVVESPTWWSTAMNGLDLRDAAPVGVLAEKVRAAVAEYESEVRARAEAARADLKRAQ